MKGKGEEILRKEKRIRKELWGGEFWAEGYYVATISGRGDRRIIEKYIRKQGREKDLD